MVTSRLEPSLHAAALPRLRGVRGAVTVEADTPASVDAAVHELLDQLIFLQRTGEPPSAQVEARCKLR